MRNNKHAGSILGSIVLIGALSVNVFSQYSAYSSDITEPLLLRSWVWSGDIYEMLNHSVWDLAEDYFEVKKKKGRLVARICSSRPFEEAMASTFFDPKESVWGPVIYRHADPGIPYLASFKGCVPQGVKVNILENWLVPEGTSIESDEIYPAVDVEYLVLRELKGETKRTPANEAMFEKHIKEFVERLKQDVDRKGFVARTSRTRQSKRNAKKVMTRLKDEGIDLSRFCEIEYMQKLESYHGEEFKLEEKYTKDRYPQLKTIKINKKNK